MNTDAIMSAESDTPSALMPRDVTLICPHPWDILFAKIERWEQKDQEHARLILETFPFNRTLFLQLDANMPHRTGTISDERRIAAYTGNFKKLCSWAQIAALLSEPI